MNKTQKMVRQNAVRRLPMNTTRKNASSIIRQQGARNLLKNEEIENQFTLPTAPENMEALREMVWAKNLTPKIRKNWRGRNIAQMEGERVLFNNHHNTDELMRGYNKSQNRNYSNNINNWNKPKPKQVYGVQSAANMLRGVKLGRKTRRK